LGIPVRFKSDESDSNGISAAPLFHIIALPIVDPVTGLPEPSRIEQPACRTVDDGGGDVERRGRETRERAVWISAEGAFQAIQGALVMEAALAVVRAGTLQPQPCDNNRVSSGACEEAILSAGGWRNMYSVEACAAGSGLICYRIRASLGIELTIVARGDNERAAPTQILSIAVEEFLAI
jgi:hypothetical protein